MIGNKNITANIYRTQVNVSIMCVYFCNGFIDFMLKGKSLLDYTNLFSPNEYEINDKIWPKHFQQLKTQNFLYKYILKRWRWKNSSDCIKCNNYRRFKNPKTSYIYIYI